MRGRTRLAGVAAVAAAAAVALAAACGGPAAEGPQPAATDTVALEIEGMT